jgi:hypothetical protein
MYVYANTNVKDKRTNMRKEVVWHEECRMVNVEVTERALVTIQ